MTFFARKSLSCRNMERFVNTSVKNVVVDQQILFSFQQWILNYFQKTDNYVSYKSELPSNTKQNSNFKTKEVENKKITSNVKLLDYTINTDDIMHNKKSCYTDWDKDLYSRIQKDPQLINVLKVMDFWINIMPYKCSYLQSYVFAIGFIDNVIRNEEISRQNLIQCMHYASCLKKQTKTQNIMNIVLSKLHKQPMLIEQFTLEEMCIFCNSLFATSTKIHSQVILKNIVKILNENLDAILVPENQHMLSCLVKPLRLSKYYDYSMLDNITKNTTIFQLNNSKGTAHLLALYSDSLYSNLTHIEQFGYDFLQCFKNESKVIDVRVKDVDRFLWAFSNLGCKGCKNEIREIIVPFLLTRTLYVKKWPANFVNSLLWLQMLQCSSEELVKSVLKIQNLQWILDTGHLRNVARFSLLLSCLNIENKELLSEDVFHLQQNLLEPKMEMHLAMRKHLFNVYRVIKCLQTTLGITNVTVSYQIPCLYIAGITIKTNRTVSEIEVLESSVCLHNSDIPHGLMKLKLRLMKRMGYKVILVDKNTAELDTERLFMHIEDAIKKECYM